MTWRVYVFINIRLRKYTSHTSHLAVIQKYSEIQSGAGGVTRLCITEYTAHRAPAWLESDLRVRESDIRQPVNLQKYTARPEVKHEDGKM